jgi:methionyl-tRNA synthetase
VAPRGAPRSIRPMRFYLTTAIDYVNGRPHLGTAYEKVTADAIARAQRLRGRDVLFLMGNDEHSQKIEKAAREQGLDPLVYCDGMEKRFREAWDELGCSYDVFIRTTEPRHRRAVQEFLNRLRNNGDLEQKQYSGWYCVGCEAFKKEDELKDGKCPEHLTQSPSWLVEDNWYFKLSNYTERLKAHYAAHPDFVQPEFRKNELLALFERGLEDVSVSRQNATWGIPFPFDPSARVYVWFDALVNYATGAGFPDDPEAFAKWWPADVHVVGKDITRFHCAVWPAMLMAANLPLPKTVFGHGYVNFSGGRMSKSAGSSVDPVELARKYTPDALRYYLCREATYGQDMEFAEERLRSRANSDLANGYGNLLNRVTSMAHKYFGGVLSADVSASPLVVEARGAVRRACDAFDRFDLSGAAAIATGLVERGNAHVDARAPWALAKDPAKRDELALVMAELAHVVLIASGLLLPFLPNKAAEAVRRLTGIVPDPKSYWTTLADAGVPRDRPLEQGPPIFPRVEEPPAAP